MNLTRRRFVLSAGAGLMTSGLAAPARAEGQILTWHGKSGIEHARLREDAVRNGYRTLSLSIYGITMEWALLLLRSRMSLSENRSPPFRTCAKRDRRDKPGDHNESGANDGPSYGSSEET